MFRAATTFMLMAVLISNALADDADKPKLGKAIYPDAIRFVSNTSEDRGAATMLFDNFVLATSDGKGDLLESRTKSFSIANKVEAKDAVSVMLDVRGFVSTMESGSAALVVQAGGMTTLVDLTKAIASAKEEPRDTEDALFVAVKENSKAAGFSVNSRPRGSEDYFVRIPASLAKGQPLQATVLLLVDRLPDTGSEAMITVDTIDVSVSADVAPTKTEKSADGEKSETKTAEPSTKKESPAKKVSSKSDEGEKSTSKKNTERKTDDKKSDDKE